MRRLIIGVITFAVLFAIAGGIFLAYNKHERLMKCEDYLAYNNSLSESGHYIGHFKPKNSAYRITKYECRVENNILYITLYSNVGTKEPLPVDENGYITIEYEAGKNIESIVYYEDENNEKKIPYKKVL